MQYILVFFILFFISYIELNYNKNNIWKISYFILFLFLCLRYGQGTDYFNYERHWLEVNKGILESIFQEHSHIDLIVRVMMGIFKWKEYSYESFIVFYSIMLMFFLYLNLKFITNKATFLFIFYPIIYLQYYFSGIRQGMAITLGMSAFFYLVKKKYSYFLFWIIVGAGFHKSILILLILPFLLKLRLKEIYILIIVSIILLLIRFDIILLKMVPVVLKYIEISDINIWALANRIIFVLFLFFLLKDYKFIKLTKEDIFLWKLVIFGLLFFIIFAKSQLLASRINIYFKVCEIYIISKYIWKVKNKKFYMRGLVIVLGILLVKELYSYLYQVNYINKNIIKYPYITIFNKEKIYLFRENEEIKKARGR